MKKSSLHFDAAQTDIRERNAMSTRAQILQWCDETLQTAQFKDYAPNGLQVEGADEIRTVVTSTPHRARRLILPPPATRKCCWCTTACSGKASRP